MFEELVTADLPLSRKSILPGAGFFLPDELEAERDEERARAALEGADAAVVADPDADGLACVALLREAYDDIQHVPSPPETSSEVADSAVETGGDTAAVDPPEAGEAGEVAETGEVSEVKEGGEAGEGAEGGEQIISGETGGAAELEIAGQTEDELSQLPHRVALVPAGPHEIEDGLENVADYAPSGIDLYVCDLCPDRFEYVETELEAAVAVADTAAWYDHHQWDESIATAVRESGVDLVVGDSEQECTADVVYRSLEFEFDDQYEELAAVTRDHDLWLREDSRSDDLADYAYWSDPAEYVEVIREYGVDLPDWVQEFLEDRRVEKDALIEQAVGRAEFREIGEYTVGVTYGRCSQNEVAEAMREQGADASVIVKPAGSASIRGTEAFQRCHEVAGRVDGGGHPKAAGCKPDIYDDMLDYAHHWTSRGAVTKQVILDGFRAVVDEDDSSEEEQTG